MIERVHYLGVLLHLHAIIFALRSFLLFSSRIDLDLVVICCCIVYKILLPCRCCCIAVWRRREIMCRYDPKRLTFGEDIPVWRRVPYLLGNYRVDYTFTQAIGSLFYWHNETLNIWTHLIGAFFSFAWHYYSLHTWLLGADRMDILFFHCFMIGSHCQMLGSVSHHWFGCMDRSIYLLTAKLDYSAIAILIPSMTCALLYELLQCQTYYLTLYISLDLLLSVIVLFLCFLPSFQRPAFQPYRALVFTLLGIFIAVPWFHGFTIYPELMYSWGIIYQLLCGAIMFMGVAIYVSRQPEKSNPGKHDFCHSHCIWHLFVIGGVWAFYATFYEVYFWRLNEGPCANL